MRKRPPPRRPAPAAPPPAQVLLPPNFKAVVARTLYSDPAHPGCRFVDLAESRSAEHVF